PITPVALQTDYALSSSQRRLWILSRFEHASTAYHMAGSYLFEGAFDINSFTRSFDLLIGRHESLRTIFGENEYGDIRQFIRTSEESGARLEYFDLCNETQPDENAAALARKEFEKPFDLSSGPLVRATLYRVSDNRFIFAYVMHHIISDGLSMQI